MAKCVVLNPPPVYGHTCSVQSSPPCVLDGGLQIIVSIVVCSNVAGHMILLCCHHTHGNGVDVHRLEIDSNVMFAFVEVVEIFGYIFASCVYESTPRRHPSI